jgi:hypothetical protein
MALLMLAYGHARTSKSSGARSIIRSGLLKEVHREHQRGHSPASTDPPLRSIAALVMNSFGLARGGEEWVV